MATSSTSSRRAVKKPEPADRGQPAAARAAKPATRAAKPAARATKPAAKPAARTAAAASKTAKPAAKTAARSSRSHAGTQSSGWSARELAAVRKDLQAHRDQLRTEYDAAMVALDTLQRSGSDTAGDDQADAGSKTFDREQEMSIANNRRDLLSQMDRALARVDEGTYGRCEECGKPIAKPRLQAFPSATLCVTCKQREERR